MASKEYSRNMFARRRFVTTAAAAIVAAPAIARAQKFPSGRVTLVVPFPAGAATDIGARIYAEALSAMWGQPVVVDNKGGGNGIPAAEVVARAKPDGLTMFATSAMTQAVNPAIYDKLPYDPVESFEGDHAARHLALRAAGRQEQPDQFRRRADGEAQGRAGQAQLRRRVVALARRVRALQDGGGGRGCLCRLQEQPAGDPRRAERPAHLHDDRHRERQARDRARRAQGPVRDRRDALSAAAGRADGRGGRSCRCPADDLDRASTRPRARRARSSTGSMPISTPWLPGPTCSPGSKRWAPRRS